MTESPLRVLLLDEGFMSGAYAATGLRDAGCAITVLAATGGRGRHRGRGIEWRLGPHHGHHDFLASVDALLRERAVHVVLPATEPIQRRVHDARPAWLSRVFPPLAPWQRRVLEHKWRLSAFAEAQGVDIPAQVAIDHATASVDDVARAVARLGAPVVVKGARGRGGSATRIVHTVPEAVAALARLRPAAGDCFLQEYVPGATHLVGGLFDEGTPLRLYAAEKLALHPPRTGPSIRLRSGAEPALLRAALRLFAALRISGLASADFIRHPDGRHLLLEVNPRPWGSITAAAEAGVDLFTPFAALLRGERPDADLRFRAGVESTVFPLYLAAPGAWRGMRAAGDLWRDLRGVPGEPWRHPGQAAHLVHRLLRVARNWPVP